MNYVTLEEDLQRIYAKRGLEIIKETVKKGKGESHIWIIEAVRKGTIK